MAVARVMQVHRCGSNDRTCERATDAAYAASMPPVRPAMPDRSVPRTPFCCSSWSVVNPRPFCRRFAAVVVGVPWSSPPPHRMDDVLSEPFCRKRLDRSPPTLFFAPLPFLKLTSPHLDVPPPRLAPPFPPTDRRDQDPPQERGEEDRERDGRDQGKGTPTEVWWPAEALRGRGAGGERGKVRACSAYRSIAVCVVVVSIVSKVATSTCRQQQNAVSSCSLRSGTPPTKHRRIRPAAAARILASLHAVLRSPAKVVPRPRLSSCHILPSQML